MIKILQGGGVVVVGVFKHWFWGSTPGGSA